MKPDDIILYSEAMAVETTTSDGIHYKLANNKQVKQWVNECNKEKQRILNQFLYNYYGKSVMFNEKVYTTRFEWNIEDKFSFEATGVMVNIVSITGIVKWIAKIDIATDYKPLVPVNNTINNFQQEEDRTQLKTPLTGEVVYINIEE